MKYLFILLTILTTSCATRHPAVSGKSPAVQSFGFVRTYNGTRKEVWKAAVSALEYYTIIKANVERGYLESDEEAEPYNESAFRVAKVAIPMTRKLATAYAVPVYLSKFKIQLIEESETQSSVAVLKYLKQYNNQLGVYEEIGTDGLEEAVFFQNLENALKEQK